MDGRQTPLVSSLQRTLNQQILIATLVFSLLTGVISGWTAFDEARELQDHQLQQIATLLAPHISAMPPTDLTHEDVLVVQRLPSNTLNALPIPTNTADGLQTLSLNHATWRVYVYSDSSGRYATSQRTAIRDEEAWFSALRTMLPILLLAPWLMGIVRFAIRHGFQAVQALADLIDKRNENTLDSLPLTAVPLEILPFVNAINRLLQRLQQAVQQQRRFIADAAHELRTPVTALSLLTDSSATNRMDLIRTGVERLRTLINQLLNLARLQSVAPPIFTPVELQSLLQDNIAELYVLAEAKKLDIGVLHSEPTWVAGQTELLNTLIRNALKNAIRYTPERGKIDITLMAQQHQAILRIQDTGCGIPEVELAQVFEPFYRANNNAESGNGLGLTISHEIALRLKGTITLRNQPHGGLQFEYRQALITDAAR